MRSGAGKLRVLAAIPFLFALLILYFLCATLALIADWISGENMGRDLLV